MDSDCSFHAESVDGLTILYHDGIKSHSLSPRAKAMEMEGEGKAQPAAVLLFFFSFRTEPEILMVRVR